MPITQVPFTYNGTTDDASALFPEDDYSANSEDADVLFCFSPSASQTLIVTAGPDTTKRHRDRLSNTILYVYNQDLTRILAYGTNGNRRAPSTLTYDFVAGTPYYVVLGGFDPQGYYTFSVNAGSPPQPPPAPTRSTPPQVIACTTITSPARILGNNLNAPNLGLKQKGVVRQRAGDVAYCFVPTTSQTLPITLGPDSTFGTGPSYNNGGYSNGGSNNGNGNGNGNGDGKDKGKDKGRGGGWDDSDDDRRRLLGDDDRTLKDTYLYVLGAGGSVLAENDDVSKNKQNSAVTFSFVAGRQYYIVATGFGNKRGYFALNLGTVPPPAKPRPPPPKPRKSPPPPRVRRPPSPRKNDDHDDRDRK